VLFNIVKSVGKMEFWSLVRGMQLVVFMAMMRVDYSAFGEKIMQLYMNFAQADVFEATLKIYEELFKFAINQPLNDRFSAYDVESMNCLPVSGSLILPGLPIMIL
jgi:hypothetical protein